MAMCFAYGCCIRTGMLSSYQVVLQVRPKSTDNSAMHIDFSEWSHKKNSREVPVAGIQVRVMNMWVKLHLESQKLASA
jgi:hypothetical protein